MPASTLKSNRQSVDRTRLLNMYGIKHASCPAYENHVEVKVKFLTWPGEQMDGSVKFAPGENEY